MEKLTMKEWCNLTGIRLNKPSGFKFINYNTKMTRRQFRRGIQASYITVKTDKGLNFLKEW